MGYGLMYSNHSPVGQFPQVKDPLVFLHSTGGFDEHVCLFSLHSSTSFMQAGLDPDSSRVQPCQE